jgi:hypothetical protein
MIEQPNECKSWLWLTEKIGDEFPDAYRYRKPGTGPGSFPDAPPDVKWKIGKLPSYEVPLGNRDGFEADFLRVEGAFRTEIETAIRAQCSGRPMPMSEEVRYFVAVRAYVVIWFVRRFEISREIPASTKEESEATETIIPFPWARPWPGIIKWLMIDWWKHNGPEMAALLRLQEMYTGLEPEQ